MVMVLGAIKKISAKVSQLTIDIKTLKPKIETTVDKINSLSDNVDSLVTKVNKNVDVLSKVVEKVKDSADEIIDFQSKVRSRIEPPLMETANTIAAFSVGIKTFIEKMKSSKNKNHYHDESFDRLAEIEESVELVNKELDDVNAKLTDLQR